MSAFVVHHDIAFRALTGGDLIRCQGIKFTYLRRRRGIGTSPPISTAEAKLIVTRPCEQHERIGYDDNAVGGKPAHNGRQRRVINLDAPWRRNAEETQHNGKNISHQIKVTGPQNDSENRIPQPDEQVAPVACANDVVFYDGRIPRSGLTQAARMERLFASALGKPTIVVAATMAQ